MLQLFLKRLINSFFTFLAIAFILFLVFEKSQPDIPLLFKNTENIKNFSAKYQEGQQKKFIAKHQLNIPWFYFSVKSSEYSKLIPSLHYNGFKNRFHLQITGFFTCNWGVSYSDNELVFNKIMPPLFLTLFIGIISLVISFVIGIFMGLYLAQNNTSKFSVMVRNGLYLLQLIPVFLIAFLLIYLFSNKSVLYIFPSYGISNYNFEWNCFIGNFPYLILPVSTFVLSTVGFIARQTEVSALQIMQEEYILNARAIGFDNKHILLKFVLPNISTPLISTFCSLIPVFLGGSVIIEYIFSISGLGRLAFQSFLLKDIPVAWSISLIVTLITVLSYWLADIMLYQSDPRLQTRINKFSTQW